MAEHKNGLRRGDVMSTIKRKLHEFKHYIIFGALALGGLELYGMLPQEISLFGGWTRGLYIAIVGTAAYCYNTFHHQRTMRIPKMSKQRTPVRNLNRPKRQPIPQAQPQPRSEAVQRPSTENIDNPTYADHVAKHSKPVPQNPELDAFSAFKV